MGRSRELQRGRGRELQWGEVGNYKGVGGELHGGGDAILGGFKTNTFVEHLICFIQNEHFDVSCSKISSTNHI